MERFAVKFEGVCKEFPFYHHITTGGIKSFLLHLPKSITSLRKTSFVALKGLSFEIAPGETLGIIGVNGSGKSTILGLIAGVLKSDKGSVSVNGRVSSLLELGAGFHPDLSGKENIILNGILLGLTRQQILGKMDRIIEFSGLGEFIYQPVRTYSSGMYARLGFSVAAHIEHDILLVDEAIAVGDAEFQAKCLDKIAEIKESGVTIVIVSHDMSLINKICDRAVWIDEGMVKSLGKPELVVREYLTGIELQIGLSEQTAEPPCTAEEERIPTESKGKRRSSWWDSPLVLGHIERLITGDEDVNFYRFLKRGYVRSTVDRGLSLRSRLPGIEANFVKGGICRDFDVMEVSPDSRTLSEDVNNIMAGKHIISRERYYDLFFFVDVLSRLNDLKGFLKKTKKALKDGGLIISLEYIGKGHGALTKEHEEILGMFYLLLPDRYKRNGGSFPQRADDSLRLGSSSVINSLAEFFTIDAIKYLGGSLYEPLFSNVPVGFDVVEQEASSLIKVILDFEQVLIGKGILSDSYALIIAKNRV